MSKLCVLVWIFTSLCFAGLWTESWCGLRHKHNKPARRFLISHSASSNSSSNGPSGAWPSVFNLATKARIEANATCGQNGREEFCRESNSPRGRSAQCGVCDAHSPDPNKRHPIEYAIDGNNNHWWQSPSLAEGTEFESVTVTLDLGQIYEIAHIIVRAGASPRPAAWALEHSIDGDFFKPWQYFGRNSAECQDLFGVPAIQGKPKPRASPEPTCMTFHSKITPVENGEIHLSLLGGIDEWTKARWVRLRLLGLHTGGSGRPARRFYTLRDLTVGGRCFCSGHAHQCRHNVARGHPECECVHHACGPSCDHCCPMFNQLPFQPGTILEPNICQSCQCHGHAEECIYDPQVEEQQKSIDVHGHFRGGGVCINCKRHTTGINCELCEAGYFRPPGILPDNDEPCILCDCDVNGSTGNCIFDQREDSIICECKEGYAGLRCDRCDLGYKGYPLCEMCACNRAGSIFVDECNGECQCKYNVHGKHCDKCRDGYFALDENDPDGCMPCYCSGVSTMCHSVSIENHVFQTLQNWTITDINTSLTANPVLDPETGWLTVADYDLYGVESYYWNAPDLYLGNKLKAYGSFLIFRVGWVVMRGDTSGKPTMGPNMIIIGHNGMKIAYGDISYEHRNEQFEFSIPLIENSWYHIPASVKDIVTRSKRTEYKGDKVTRTQFMSVIANIKNILLRAKFHTDQVEGNLEGALILFGNENFATSSSKVEKCICPPGYTGLSCEICAFGYIKIFTNTTNHLEKFECIKCDCNGHAESCDLINSKCSPCEHNTMGEKCERCISGYYGNPLIGTRDDCKRCACPLLEDSNNFSPSCAMDGDKYFCTQCPEGYTGDHCEICDDGYFGNPLDIGSICEPCNCKGAPCDGFTGQCLLCPGNTEGFKCDSCKENHYGIASEKDCKPCDCDMNGSESLTCNPITGKCICRNHFEGRTCNSCQKGYGNITAGCMPCNCNEVGAESSVCDPIVGDCECRPGVEGFHCDACQYLHYGFSSNGCQSCNCNKHGSKIQSCDIKTGQCTCFPHVIGLKCNQCQIGYWGLETGRGCSPCKCDTVGTQSGTCDIQTGECLCKPGVGGQNCDTCLPGYYGFSQVGCTRCNCNERGSKIQSCDIETGQCRCLPHVTGLACDQCQIGYWGLESGQGCSPCKCNSMDTLSGTCDINTGECLCKTGLGGENCDTCLPGYYGFSKNGCIRCEICSPGQICDPDTGRCVCPPLVQGPKCSECRPGSWGIEPLKGCKYCNCSAVGSIRSQCDPSNGNCLCQEGFAGPRCDKCASMYFGFPRCRPCACNYLGTIPEACNQNDRCHCDEKGKCPCKANVEGLKCNECKNGTFGLSSENSAGCTQCFCFGRTSHCTQAGLTRGHIRLNFPRTLQVRYNLDLDEPSKINHILISSYGEEIFNIYENLNLNVTSGITIIPSTESNVTIDVNGHLAFPLYWQLPEKFLGDRITSYGGFLKFKISNLGHDEKLSFNELKRYPLVQLHAQGVVILEYYEVFPSENDVYEVRFHESLWALKTSRSSLPYSVDRTMIMVALKQIDGIYIRGTNYRDIVEATLTDVSMDTAIAVQGQLAPLVNSVELCSCPYQYNATSCQDASIGFYMPPHQLVSNASGTIIIQLNTKAEPCKCNDRSETCDKDTGHCTNCRENTGGPYCEQCAEGYFGDPWGSKGCLPCPCPHSARNNALSCHIRPGRITCRCKDGYSGPDCSICARGWWLGNDGKCQRCECDGGGVIKSFYGSVSECHPTTGQCPCYSYVTGMRCDSCITPRHFLVESKCVSCDNCSQTLLDDIELLTYELEKDSEHLKHASIPKPWTALHQVSNKTLHLKIKIENTILAIERLKALPEDEFDELENRNSLLLWRAKSIEEKWNQSNANMCRLRQDSNKLFDDLIEARKVLEDKIRVLEDFTRHEKHLNVNRAIKDAKHMIRKIKGYNFGDYLRSVQNSSEQATLKSTVVEEYIYQVKDHTNKIEEIKQKLDKFIDGIYEIDKFVENVWNLVDIVDESVAKNKQTLKNINNITNQIEKKHDEIKVTNDNKFIQMSDVLLNESQDDLDNLKNLEIILKNLTAMTAEREGILSRINPEYKEAYLIPAQKHVEDLINLAKKYKGLLNDTESNTSPAIKASSAYNDIVKTIEAAKIAAFEALKITELADKTVQHEESIQSNEKTSLLKISHDYIKKSNDLIRQASENSLKGVNSNLEKWNRNLETLMAVIRNLGYKQKNINLNFTTSIDSIATNLDIANDKSNRIYRNMQALQKEADEIHNNILYKLKMKFQDLQNHGDDKIGGAEEKISLLRGSIHKSNELATSLMEAARRRENEMRVANTSLAKNIQYLKDQIQRAKHAADGVRISVQSSPNKGCSRSYRISNLAPSATTHLVATLCLTPTVSQDAIIFFLASSTTNDFIKLEILNRKVKFSWNLGNDTTEIIHPELLDIIKDPISTKGWYKLEAIRIWNIGKLWVRKIQSQDDRFSSIPVTNASNPSHGILDVNFGDSAWIGSLGEEFQKDVGLPGCLHKINFNGKHIGLWNFNSQSSIDGCKGCIDGVEETRTEQNLFYWNGVSYSVLKRSDFRPFNKNQFSILLTFRTFDENALLFLAVDEANNRSISLQLQEGRVVFKIDYSDDTQLIINTTEKYNTGKFVQVQATRVFIKKKIEKGSLNVDGYEQLGSPNPPVINSHSLPDLTESEYYLGGTPPEWKPLPFIQSLPPPFLGCMGEITIDNEVYNPIYTSKYFNVENSCSNKPLYSVGFYGDGFLELPSQKLRKKSHLALMFRTLQRNAFLLLSAPHHYHYLRINDFSESSYTTESEFELHGGPLPSSEGFYSLSLVDGKIHLLMNAGKGDLKLVSNVTDLNDGYFHAVSIVKHGRRVEMFINDIIEATGTLPPGSVVIHSNSTGGLFLGGVPNHLNDSNITNQHIASTISLRGAIKDIVLDGEVISMENVIDMNHAFIGRLGPSMGKEYEVGANLLNTQQSGFDSNKVTNRCHKVHSYTLEPGAVKFGDTPNSYTQVQMIGRTIWQKDFSLEFDFRTYYPSGLLLISPGVKEKQRHPISLFLLDGKVTLIIKGKKKRKLPIPINTNDGNWHHVSIKLTQKRLSLSVGSKSVLTRMTRMPKILTLSNTVYIGGIPEKSTIKMSMPEQISKMEGFKGCIRRLHINGKAEDLVKDPALHQNVGQCFPSIEMGSYFPGDAYAIYKRQFILSAHLELRLEFRSVEVNGILLSVTHANPNAASLSLELHNARVVMSVLTTSGRRFRVQTGLPNPFGLCDNKWHNITALFSADELTVRVDQQPGETDVGKSLSSGYTTPPSINQPILQAPLYIGGLPDGAPTGTLATKDNFKGCIRNIVMQGHHTDWTDMDSLHNLLLSSCPVQ